ncbi:MAG: hypothetical protein JNL08_00160 [Planctomycetes bacterium]|nr:hypothetical protein [Planctomycetota bacterium]
MRQQTMIAASHLTALVGHPIMAFELRRNAANETYAGGTAHLTVKLSTAPHDPLSSSPEFAANVGGDEVQVFSGNVTLPTSPPAVGPAVAWSAANTIRVEFSTPFVYLGGTLCVDVTGIAVGGLNADWWMADAACEGIKGTAVDLGGGCGPYGGPQSQWSHVATRTLVAGGQARFFAYGEPWTVGVAVFGTGMVPGIPLAWLGFPSPPTCELHLASILLLSPVVFEPDANLQLAHRGGLGDVRLPFANDGSFLGVTFTTQWLELSQWQTSNAIEWTTAAAPPQLGMTLVEGHPAEASGELSAHLAHVFRFEYL